MENNVASNRIGNRMETGWKRNRKRTEMAWKPDGYRKKTGQKPNKTGQKPYRNGTETKLVADMVLNFLILLNRIFGAFWHNSSKYGFLQLFVDCVALHIKRFMYTIKVSGYLPKSQKIEN